MLQVKLAAASLKKTMNEDPAIAGSSYETNVNLVRRAGSNPTMRSHPECMQCSMHHTSSACRAPCAHRARRMTRARQFMTLAVSGTTVVWNVLLTKVIMFFTNREGQDTITQEQASIFSKLSVAFVVSPPEPPHTSTMPSAFGAQRTTQAHCVCVCCISGVSRLQVNTMLVPLCIVIYFSASDKGDGHVVDQTWCVDPLAHAPRAHAHVHPRTCTLARASSHAHPRACILARAHPRKRTLARASSRVHPLMRIACARPAHRFEADGLVQPVFILCVANWATEALKAVMPAPILQRCVLSRLLSPSSAVSHLLLPAFTFLGRLSPSIRYVLSRLVFSQQKLNRTYEPPPFNLGLLYSQAVKTVAFGASHRRAQMAAHSVHRS